MRALSRLVARVAAAECCLRGASLPPPPPSSSIAAYLGEVTYALSLSPGGRGQTAALDVLSLLPVEAADLSRGGGGGGGVPDRTAYIHQSVTSALAAVGSDVKSLTISASSSALVAAA